LPQRIEFPMRTQALHVVAGSERLPPPLPRPLPARSPEREPEPSHRATW
jgi:hypothetical protein